MALIGLIPSVLIDVTIYFL